MLETKNYVKNEKIVYLKEILRNFDNFEIGKKYTYKYNSHVRDFEYELHKLNPQTIYMYIFDNKIEITKINDRKFEVIVNLNDYKTIAERRRIEIFMKVERNHYNHYPLYYYRKVWHFSFDGTFGNLIIPIRHDSRLLKLIIIKKPQRYYLTLPELTKRELPDKEFGYPIIPNNLYLYSINGKKVKDMLEHYKRKYKGMPYIIRVKLQNRKVEYAIFKMLLKKGIFKYLNDLSIKPPFRIRQDDLRYYEWEFMNIITPIIERMRGGQFPNFTYIALQDYDYDNVNQVLLKFIDTRNDTYLCGVDYANNMWCMRLSGFMYKYKIKSVYKVLYNLDENTKLFEF
jgi:hypothetical protein